MEPHSKNILPANQRKKPGLFYGYYVAVSTFAVILMGWGIFSVYGVFFNPLSQEFGWSRALTSGAFSLSVLISGTAGVFAGRFSDKLGPRKVITFCTVLLVLGYFLMSMVQSIWQFYAIFGLVIGLGVSGCWSPPVTTVSHWFTGRRGLMTGIVSGGISVGVLVLSPVITQIISAYSWRTAYIIVSVAILIVMMTAVQFIKRNPQEMGLRPFGEARATHQTTKAPERIALREAMRAPQFWMVCFIYVFYGFTQLLVMVHIIPDAIGKGISAINAAGILSVIGVVSLLGRIAMGSIADRVRVRTAAIISLIFLGVALIWLLQSDSLWKFYLFAVVFGFGYGGLSGIQPLLAVELFGLFAVGVITAIFSFFFNLGGAVGPVLAGFIFDVNESYQWAFIICLILIAIALALAVALKPIKKIN